MCSGKLCYLELQYFSFWEIGEDDTYLSIPPNTTIIPKNNLMS